MLFAGGRDQFVLADTQVSETFVTPVRIAFLFAVAKRRGVFDDVGVGPRFRPRIPFPTCSSRYSGSRACSTACADRLVVRVVSVSGASLFA